MEQTPKDKPEIMIIGHGGHKSALVEHLMQKQNELGVKILAAPEHKAVFFVEAVRLAFPEIEVYNPKWKEPKSKYHK